jgi:hypothetical protein
LLLFLRGPAVLAVVSLVVVTGAAIGAWGDITSPELGSFCHPARGANIVTALKIAGFGAPATAVAILVVRKRRRLLLLALLLAAAVVSVALALVASESASYAGNHCTSLFGGSSTHVLRDHVTYLYVLWGIPLVALVVDAGRAWRDSAPGDAEHATHSSPR